MKTKFGKVVKKPPKKLLYICKKLKVKTTTKRGSKRVYKSVSTLKRACLKKIKNLKKKYYSFGKRTRRRTKRKVSKRKVSRRTTVMKGGVGHMGKLYSYGKKTSRFGTPAPFSSNQGNFGYNDPYPTNSGVNYYTTQGSGFYKPFFGADVPAVIPPEWDCNRQPDGSCVPVGSPFLPNNFGNKKVKFGKKNTNFGNKKVKFGKNTKFGNAKKSIFSRIK